MGFGTLVAARGRFRRDEPDVSDVLLSSSRVDLRVDKACEGFIDWAIIGDVAPRFAGPVPAPPLSGDCVQDATLTDRIVLSGPVSVLDDALVDRWALSGPAQSTFKMTNN